MEFSKIKEILAEEAKRLGVTEYDIYFSKSESLSAETLKQEISSFSSSNGIGISFRCIRDGKFGYASSELITPEETGSTALVKTMLSLGAIGARMSGSGASVFGVFPRQGSLFAAKASVAFVTASSVMPQASSSLPKK